MANYNSFTSLIIDIGPVIQETLRSRGSLFQYANTDFSNDAKNKGDTIDAVFAPALTYAAITPSPSGTNAPPMTPTRVQLVLNNWGGSSFVITSKEEQEIRNGSQFLQQALLSGVEALVSQMELTYIQTAVSGAINAGQVVTLGNAVSSSLTPVYKAKKYLADALAPSSGRALVYNTTFGLNLAANTTLLKVNEAGTADLLRSGQQSNILGFALQESNFLGNSNASYSGSTSMAVAFQHDGLGIAVRPANVNSNVVIINDPVTGMPITISTWEQEYQRKVAVGALWGVKSIRDKFHAIITDN